MNLWCPWANRDVLGNAGDYLGTEPYCGVLHTTEGVTYAGARAAYVKNNSAPHFTITYERQAVKLYQHSPLDRAGRALKNASGGVQTNRRRCIQIEIVCFADMAKAVAYKGIYVAGLPDPYLAGIASLMRWIEGETGIQPNYPTFKKYPASYGTNNGVRFSFSQWRSFNGWCGHQHVPENSHGDPGEIPITRLFDPPPPQHDPRSTVYDPPFQIPFDIVSSLRAPNGGVWVLTKDGRIYAFHAPDYGAPYGRSYWVGRTARELVPNGDGFTVVATSGESYSYP